MAGSVCLRIFCSYIIKKNALETLEPVVHRRVESLKLRGWSGDSCWEWKGLMQ